MAKMGNEKKKEKGKRLLAFISSGNLSFILSIHLCWDDKCLISPKQNWLMSHFSQHKWCLISLISLTKMTGVAFHQFIYADITDVSSLWCIFNKMTDILSL